MTTQARVLETIRDLCHSHQVAAVYVSHDLAVVAELADGVAVMYAERIVERGARDAIRAPACASCCAPVPDVDGKRAVVVAKPAPLPATGCRLLLRAALRSGHRPLPRRRFRPPPSSRAATSPATARAPSELPTAGTTQAAARTVWSTLTVSGPVHILHDIEVRRNECVAVVGESGSSRRPLHLRAALPIQGGHQAGQRPAGQRPAAQLAGRQRINATRTHTRRTRGAPSARSPGKLQLFGAGSRGDGRRVAECLERVARRPAVNRYLDQLSRRGALSWPPSHRCDEVLGWTSGGDREAAARCR